MKKIFDNKILALIFILIMGSFFFSSAKPTQAGGAVDLFQQVANSVLSVDPISNAVTNVVNGLTEVVLGGLFGDTFLYNDGQCRLENPFSGVSTTYPSGCSASIVVGASDICAFAVSLTFYNPQMNTGTEPAGLTPEGDCQSTGVDETTRNVAIYRFVLPAGGDLNGWFINSIKQSVGNGYLDYEYGDYHTANDSAPWRVLPYSGFCSGNVCTITDATVPPNVYVAYVAKIVGSYDYVSPYSNDYYYNWPAKKASAQSCSNQPNKFLNKDNGSWVAFPGSGLGNAIIGPFSTINSNCADCIGINAVDSITAGQDFNATVSMKNSGAKTWTDACLSNGYKLGSQNAQDNMTWGLNRASLPLISDPYDSCETISVRPGESVTFDFTATAPSAAGTYPFDWKMVQEGVEWFGATCRKDILVNPIPPPGSFTLTQGSPLACNSIPLSWTASSGATGYRILRGSPRVNIAEKSSGVLNYTDTTATQNTSYVYQIEAYNAGGSTRSNAITINTPYCPPSISFSANPSTIYQGQKTTLTWSAANATSCTASGNWSGSKAANGTEQNMPTVPPSASFTLSCTGPGGSASQSVNVSITPMPNWKEIIPR